VLNNSRQIELLTHIDICSTCVEQFNLKPCLYIVLQNVITYCGICSLIFSAPCRLRTHSIEQILCVNTFAARLVHLEIYNLDPEKKVCYKAHLNREHANTFALPHSDQKIEVICIYRYIYIYLHMHI